MAIMLLFLISFNDITTVFGYLITYDKSSSSRAALALTLTINNRKQFTTAVVNDNQERIF
jgi:hypothetical protein